MAAYEAAVGGPATSSVAAVAAPRPDRSPASEAQVARDRVVALRELAALRDAGDLTQEEFESEKARVLAS